MAGRVTVRRVEKLENQIEAGEHRLTADEPASAGGADRGPDPYALLLAALGACISMTLTLYAERKRWPLEGVEVKLSHRRVHAEDCVDCGEGTPRKLDLIEKELVLSGPLDEAQKQRLREIADRCPVHRTLAGEVRIVSI